MKHNITFQIYPTSKQESELNKTLENARHVYNWILETRKHYFEEKNQKLSGFDINKMITVQRKFDVRFKDVNSGVLQNISGRIDIAIKAFFKRLKQWNKTHKGPKPGYPRFKGENRLDSITYPTVPKVRLISKKWHTINLGKSIGKVKMCLHQEVTGKAKTITVKRSNGKWFATICYEIEMTQKVKTEKKEIALDYGITHFVTDQDGNVIDHPKPLKESLERKRKISRQISKAKEEGNETRLKKKREHLSNLEFRIRNRRKDFNHKLSRKLVDEYSHIYIEDLNLQQMAEDNWKHLNRHSADESFGMFVQFLTYKAEEAGCQLVKVNPAYTSQVCSDCGRIIEKELSERVHECSCGLKMDRDQNAARNILRLGRESLAHSLEHG